MTAAKVAASRGIAKRPSWPDCNPKPTKELVQVSTCMQSRNVDVNGRSCLFESCSSRLLAPNSEEAHRTVIPIVKGLGKFRRILVADTKPISSRICRSLIEEQSRQQDTNLIDWLALAKDLEVEKVHR